jgi:cobalt-zinc-cadmium efflux system protein
VSHPHHHGHGAHRSQDKRRLALALSLTAGLMVAEVVGGLLTGSLALLADAGHMLSDAGSLALALVAVRLAERPATPERSFGFKRAEVLAALANGVTLVLVSLWIFWEAYRRLSDPPEVLAGPVLAIAVAGLAVNGVAALVLARGESASLNVAAALRHVLADLAGSVGVIVAAGTILLTGWRYADPLVSVLIGLLVLASSWGVLRDSLRVLLEAAPRGLDPNEVGRAMVATPGVVEVHDLHVWTITSGFPALSAHVLVGPGQDCHERRRDLERVLHERFDIEHTTLQVDHAPAPLQLEVRAPGGGGG